ELAAGEGATEERALWLVERYAFRTHQPCENGRFPAMLFRFCSRFNHGCFPNAGGQLPGTEALPSVESYRPPALSVYALEEIREGQEVCISYLSESDELSPLRERRAALQSWGFLCSCDRCQGGRPLDRRLEAVEMREVGVEGKQAAVAKANAAYRAMFDPDFEGYDPPKDFEGTVERLSQFREDFRLLDAAHVVSQRVRKELLAAFLLDGPNGAVAQRCAGPAVSLLVEEMQMQHALLPSLSPHKAIRYAQFLELVKHLPEKEA
ncbi:unnamed protein product, partial [Effrenium voratum]